MLSAFFSAMYVVEPAVARLLVHPRVVLRALPVEPHQRDAVAARVGNPLDLDADHRAHGVLGRVEARRELMRRRQHRRATVQSHDSRRPFERAEHHDDAAVLARMRDRLRSAADEVEVPDLVRPEDSEPAQVALRRHVHVAVLRERCGADEEEVLPLDPGRELLVDLRVDLAHGESVAFGHAHSALRLARNRAADHPGADGWTCRAAACGGGLERRCARHARAQLGRRRGRRRPRASGAHVAPVRSQLRAAARPA